MSFGDHIEELRVHLWRAFIGLGLCLFIGFILDAIGYYTDWKMFGVPFGVGRPLMDIIQQPVRQALAAFEEEQEAKTFKEAQEEDTQAHQAIEPRPLTLEFTKEQLALLRGVKEANVAEEKVSVDAMVGPKELYKATRDLRRAIRPRELSTLSVQEGLVVYFKVSLVSGLVIASPWVFWQIWSFVAAGLYPSEKKLVHVYLPFSIGLFLVGVFVCQFLVMPKAVEAMLWFNSWLGLTPDLRLNEWLSFAIYMPLVFGISFQTPLVMLLLAKLGIVDITWFREKRRYAWFIMAVFAAVITPSADAISMLFLWVPMSLLYELGIFMIHLSPPPPLLDVDVPEADELIEV